MSDVAFRAPKDSDCTCGPSSLVRSLDCPLHGDMSERRLPASPAPTVAAQPATNTNGADADAPRAPVTAGVAPQAVHHSAVQPASSEVERAGFEAWWNSDDHGKGYGRGSREIAWLGWQARAAQQPGQPDAEREVRRLYEELLYAVASKYPDETRHQTALRYIRQREAQCHGPCGDKEAKP